MPRVRNYMNEIYNTPIDTGVVGVKVGDIVRSKFGKSLKVLEINNPHSYDFYFEPNKILALCEDLTGDLPPMWYSLDEMEKEPEETCECGSKHTSAPKFHMFYCPDFKEIK